MAIQQNIGASEDWFVGEDKTLNFEVYDSTGAAMQDIAGWSLRFRLRYQRDGDAIVFTKTTGGSGVAISGTYNSDPATNTQRAVVTIDDTDTDNLQPGNYLFNLWRTDAGSETVLAYGLATLKAAP